MPGEDAMVKHVILTAKFDAGRATRPVFHWSWKQESPLFFQGVSIRFNEQCLLADLQQFLDSWEVLFYAGERLMYRSVVWSLPNRPTEDRTSALSLISPAEFTVYLKGAEFMPKRDLHVEIAMWFLEGEGYEGTA